MHGIPERIEKLEHRLRDVDQRIEQHEEEASHATGKISDHFAQKLTDLREEHDRIAAQLSKLRVEDAETWSTDDKATGVLRIVDEIARRIDELIERLTHRD